MTKINMKRLVFAALAAWVAWMVMGYIVNTRFMAGAYADMKVHMRPDADMNQLLPLGFAFGIAAFLILSWIYAKGYEGGSGVSEGLRFGFLIGLLFVTMAIVWEFIVFPVTQSVFIAWTIDTIVEMTILGVIIGLVYKPLATGA